MQNSPSEVAEANGTPVVAETVGEKEAQAHVDGAFVFGKKKPADEAYLRTLQTGVDAARYSYESNHLTDEQREIIRKRSLYLIPARNEERRIGSVLRYLVEYHRIPLERILVMSGSTDGTDTLVRSMGVAVCQQADVLNELLHVDRFLEMQRADSLKQIAGKGITLTAGMLHLMETGKLKKDEHDSTSLVMLDSDPRYGDDNGYDPLSAFAKMRQDGAQTLKPAKNGIARNNHPVYIAANAVGVMSPYARSISEYFGRQQWLLSGEMSRPAEVSQDLVMSTGYPVETTMNISDHDLGLRIGHYADHRRRGDVDNDPAKEQVMYDFILRTLYAVVLHEVQTRKRLTECGIADIAALNNRIAGYDDNGLPWPNFIRDEDHEVPEGIEVRLPEYPRVIGSIGLLARENITRVKPW